MTNYPDEASAEDYNDDYDDGTMPNNVAELADAVVGHKIVSVEDNIIVRQSCWGINTGAVITLDTGKRVILRDTNDCCAYTELRAFLLHPDKVDHMIMGVGTTGGFETWHIYADAGDVLELTVGWSGGNLGYYGYGFEITVEDAKE